MDPILGQAIVIAALLAVLTLAVRSLWKSRKGGKGCCDGDCSHCKGCH